MITRPPAAFDPRRAARAVVAGAGQHHGDGLRAAGLGSRLEQEIDGRPGASVRRFGGERERVTVHKQMVVGRGQEDVAGEQALLVQRVAHGQG